MEFAFIFDMDGVVIDSNPYHKIAWGHFLARHGFPFNDETFDNVISGRTGSTSIRILLGKELSEEEAGQYLREIDEGFQEILRRENGIGPVPGLTRFLKAIRKSGSKTALATSAPPGNVDLTLDKLQLRPYFDVILDRTDVTRGKPDPEVYLNTVGRLRLAREQCVVFEDSKAGIQAALAAGLKVIGVTTSHSRDELLGQGAVMTIGDFKGIVPGDVFNLIRHNKTAPLP